MQEKSVCVNRMLVGVGGVEPPLHGEKWLSLSTHCIRNPPLFFLCRLPNIENDGSAAKLKLRHHGKCMLLLVQLGK